MREARPFLRVAVKYRSHTRMEDGAPPIPAESGIPPAAADMP